MLCLSTLGVLYGLGSQYYDKCSGYFFRTDKTHLSGIGKAYIIKESFISFQNGRLYLQWHVNVAADVFVQSIAIQVLF